MGAYLAKPKTEKISEGSENGQVSYGVSCMQGWRVTMEDAHTCMLDFDNSSTLFAVYDGHGGAEVAQYVSKHLPDVLKNTETYKKGEVKQSLIDSFLEVDQHIITDEGLTELKELAGVDKDLDEDEDLGLLEQEASMPLHELLAKMKEMKRLLSANSGEEESVEYWTENNEQDTGDDDDDDDDEEKNENKEQSNHIDSQNKNDSKNGKEEKKDNENGSKNEDRSSLSNMNSTSESAKDDKEKEKKDTDNENKNDEKPQQEEAETSQGEKVEGNHQINEKIPGPEDEKDDEDEEEEEDDEDDEDDDDDDEDDDDEDEQDGDGSEGFQSSDEVGYDSGTTAIVALLHKNQLTVANVGDSRCVLCRNGIALEMSMDHKPEDEHEMNRIHKAGGKVTCDGRVNGGLNLSRALGDHSYKLQTDLSAHEQQITALPDVRQTQLTEADEFMVIACDGIWNVKGSQEVVDFVADRLREQRENDMFNLENICEELLDSCLAPDTSGDGSGCDNMTSIIVVFNAAESDTATDHNNKKRKLQQDAETPDGDAADKKIKTDQNS